MLTKTHFKSSQDSTLSLNFALKVGKPWHGKQSGVYSGFKCRSPTRTHSETNDEQKWLVNLITFEIKICKLSSTCLILSNWTTHTESLIAKIWEIRWCDKNLHQLTGIALSTAEDQSQISRLGLHFWKKWSMEAHLTMVSILRTILFVKFWKIS